MKNLALCLLVLSGWSMADDIVNATDAGYALVLDEDIRFGGGDEDHFLWSSLNSKLLPGPKGNMYVVDPANTQILEFDKQGKFLRVATSKGNGPGELHNILCVSQAADGSLLIMDVDAGSEGGAPRVIRYKPDMTFKDVTLFSGTGLIPAIMNESPDAKYLGGIVAKLDMKAMKTDLITGILDIDQKKMLNTFATVSAPFPDMSRAADPAMWEDYIAEQFKILYDFGMVVFSKNGKAFVANSGTYRVSRVSPGAKEPEISFTRKYKPEIFDEKSRQIMIDRFFDMLPGQARTLITKPLLTRAMEKAKLPPTKAPMLALIAIEDKGVLVVRDTNLVTRVNNADIFDTNGKFLCSAKVKDHGLYTFTESNPSARMVFKDGYAYTILTDEDDENTAVRYRYTLKKM